MSTLTGILDDAKVARMKELAGELALAHASVEERITEAHCLLAHRWAAVGQLPEKHPYDLGDDGDESAKLFAVLREMAEAVDPEHSHVAWMSRGGVNAYPAGTVNWDPPT
jgi:hypothetical protein